MQIGTFHIHKGLVIFAAVFGVVLSIFLQKSSLKDIPLEPASIHSSRTPRSASQQCAAAIAHDLSVSSISYLGRQHGGGMLPYCLKLVWNYIRQSTRAGVCMSSMWRAISSTLTVCPTAC